MIRLYPNQNSTWFACQSAARGVARSPTWRDTCTTFGGIPWRRRSGLDCVQPEVAGYTAVISDNIQCVSPIDLIDIRRIGIHGPAVPLIVDVKKNPSGQH